MKFAVVDIETTGSLPSRDRIIEIGIVLIHNGQIVDKFQSLVNPERSIPPFIARMTGISNEDVKKAPRFYEIAKEIVLKLKGHIFVAHNVNFDYNFLKYEFKKLGYNYTSRRLCTVQLSRRLYPEYKAHGLSKIIKRFNIHIQSNMRHRALGDAKATAEFMLRAFSAKTNTDEEIKKLVNFGLHTSRIPEAISIDTLHNLPEKSGVYFFKDGMDKFVYIGKSDNIKRRVFEHFAKTGKKQTRLLQSVKSIDYELTSGNLIALIKEDRYIKKFSPLINKAQKRRQFPYVIVKHSEKEGAYYSVHTKGKARKENWKILAEFSHKKFAYHHMEKITSELGICTCEIQNRPKPNCWKLQTGSCNQASICPSDCTHFEQKISQYFQEDQLIWESLPEDNSIGFVKIESGLCTAYGQIEGAESIRSVSDIEAHTKPYRGTAYTNKVLFRELAINKKKYKRISL